jgi:hypothetical protein
VVLRRRVLETCGSYDERRYLVEDLDLWFRAGRSWQLRNLAMVLVGYRIWWGTLTRTRLRAIIWRSYRLRVDHAVSYGYYRPWMARAYGVATLAAVLFPAPMAIGLFHFVLKGLSGRSSNPVTPSGHFSADASSPRVPLAQTGKKAEALSTSPPHQPTEGFRPVVGKLDPTPLKHASAPDNASPQSGAVMR